MKLVIELTESLNFGTRESDWV